MATDSAVGVPVRWMAAEAETKGQKTMSNESEKLIKDAMDEMQSLGIDNLRAKGAIILLSEALRRAEAELDAATTQLAKKFKRLEELEKRAEKAEAERDDQQALVLRLTEERDFAVSHRQELIEQIRQTKTARDLDEARAQVWGLGCLLTNSREETEWQVEETRTLRREVRELSERLAGMPMPEDDDPAGKHLMSLINRRRELYQRVDELTATRDLLTEENARLQARVATLELLRRGGK